MDTRADMHHLEDSPEEPEEDLDDEADELRLEQYMRDRRRAKSLPNYSVALLEGPEGDGSRKRVKFADSMGLDLASVKHFSSLDEPRIPSKVLSRHKSFPPPQQDLPGYRFRSGLVSDRLMSCFPELKDADGRVQELQVCLEKVSISQFDIRGQIRVLCRSGVREVGVRYTFNDWLSHVDAQALYEQPGPVGLRFCFTVYTPPVMDPNSAVHLAVYLRSDEGEFWDNNAGQNYTLRYTCLAPEAGGFVSNAFNST